MAEGSWFVAFDANGGQSAPHAQVVTVGQDAILTLELPVNGSLAFRGWATTPDAAEVAYQPGDTLPYEEGRTYVVLFALWQLSPAPGPVIITFDANGGLAGTVPGPVSVPGETWFRLPEGMPIWDPQHQFLGWSEDSAAAEATWAAGDTAIFERDATLYAVWQAHYKVIEGAGSTYVKGSGKTVRFVADGDLRYFRELRIDGLPVTTGVTISSGSTIADVSSEVMEALPTGEHTITFVYMDGEASAGFTVQSATPPMPTPRRPRPRHRLCHLCRSVRSCRLCQSCRAGYIRRRAETLPGVEPLPQVETPREAVPHPPVVSRRRRWYLRAGEPRRRRCRPRQAAARRPRCPRRRVGPRPRQRA